MGPFPLPEGHYFYVQSVTRHAHYGATRVEADFIRMIQDRVGVPPVGRFTYETSDAVRSWTRQNGLRASGIVDSAVWAAMAGNGAPAPQDAPESPES